VPLHRELDVLDDYLEIMHVRFGDRLKVEREIDDGVQDALVPDLILQPIVENAIKHGVGPQEEGGRVRIAAQKRNGYLHLSVDDDGPGMAGDGLPEASEGIGLRNVKERLQRLYGNDHRMRIEPGRSAGVVVELRIPYHTTRTSVATQSSLPEAAAPSPREPTISAG
jgi:sensor histidine kinase YesM